MIKNRDNVFFMKKAINLIDFMSVVQGFDLSRVNYDREKSLRGQ